MPIKLVLYFFSYVFEFVFLMRFEILKKVLRIRSTYFSSDIFDLIDIVDFEMKEFLRYVCNIRNSFI